jgi:replication initiation and membrane attachment protein
MLTLEENAIFTVKAGFRLSSDQNDMLAQCYLPIIGGNAFALYTAFFSIKGNNYGDVFSSLDLAEKTGMTLAGISQSLLVLEGIGLVGCYRYEDKSKVSYIYKLFPPATPYQFFHDPSLSTLLINKCGQRRTKEILSSFTQDLTVPPEYSDVSASFSSVFDTTPDYKSMNELSGEALKAALKESEYHGPSLDFDTDVFLKELAALSVSPQAVQSHLGEIKDTAGVFGIDEKTAASIVKEDALSSNGEFFLETFNKRARDYKHFAVGEREEGQDAAFGNSDLAKRLSAYIGLAPLDFLQAALKGEPAASYKDALLELKNTYKCSNPVLNVVVDYTIQKCDGSFPTEYARKVLLSVLKADCQTAADAMAFLNQKERDRLNRKGGKKGAKAEKAEEKESNQDQTDTSNVNVKDILGEDF